MSLTRQAIEKILKKVETRKLSSRKAFEKLKNLPYETFPFARLDHHRALRKGFPEAVFAPGKSLPQLEKIIRSIQRSGQPLIVTRLEKKSFASLKRKLPKLRYSSEGRIGYWKNCAACHSEAAVRLAKNLEFGVLRPAPLRGAGLRMTATRPKVAVLTAGTSDLPVAEEAAVTLELVDLEPIRIYDCGVAGLHRLLDQVPKLQQVQAVICVAGMEGALASVVSGLIDKPVIAVPTSVGYGASFKGIAPLLTMLNSCAPGVAVVNIDNGFGAACFAASLLRSR